MKLPQLSLRDLFWLVALVAMGCGWWLESRREKLDDKSQYRAWGFDIAATILQEKTGAEITADRNGITVRTPPAHGEQFGTVTTHRFGE